MRATPQASCPILSAWQQMLPWLSIPLMERKWVKLRVTLLSNGWSYHVYPRVFMWWKLEAKAMVRCLLR